ncbi:hypothetical protein C8T65DRAFT_634634 [Cerioporus squamosus]|nr:hypothetical protein C8T65DRAFT_634634 [Cerioporus squamosus]
MFSLTASFAVSHKRALLGSGRPRLRLPYSPLGHIQRAKRLSLLGLYHLDAYEHDDILVSSSRRTRLPLRPTRRQLGAAKLPRDRCPPFPNVGAPSCPRCTPLLPHRQSQASSLPVPRRRTHSPRSSKTRAAPTPCTPRSGRAPHTTSLRVSPNPRRRSQWASRLLRSLLPIIPSCSSLPSSVTRRPARFASRATTRGDVTVRRSTCAKVPGEGAFVLRFYGHGTQVRWMSSDAQLSSSNNGPFHSMHCFP